jgi:gamma-glutamyltranspeptidase/glutathione hydrolase
MNEVAVAAPSDHAARAAGQVVAHGGGAVDAAIAAAIAAMFTEIGVAAPGAGAFVTVAEFDGHPSVHDGYMAVPGLHGRQPSPVSIRADMGYGGGLSTMVGPASVAVPGAWAAFDRVHAAHGRVDFGNLVMPTLEILREGFTIGSSCLYYLGYSGDVVFGHDPGSRAVLHANGRLVTAQERVHIPDAIVTLETLAEVGPMAMLTGEIGLRIAEDLWNRGSLIGPMDFSSYRDLEREPLVHRVGGWDLFTNPPPAVGGAGLIALLVGLERGHPSAFLEAQEQLFRWRRGPLHDTDDRHRDILAFLRDLPGDPIRSPSTVHVSAVDSDGVACAITLSAGYGSGVIPTGTGLYMNNGIGELELVGEPSALVPGERLNSNMAPTILRSNEGGMLAIGSPGADRISSALASVVGAVALDGRSLEDALSSPRMHVAVRENGDAVIKAEPGAQVPDYPLDVDRFDQLNMYFGGVGAALLEPNGRLSAAADPRRQGMAAVFGERENST